MSQPTNETIDALDDVIGEFTGLVATRLKKHEPGAPKYPMAVLLMAACPASGASASTLQLTCRAEAADMPNGKPQLLCLTRDMLALMTSLNDQHKLGIHGLREALASHPLIAPAPQAESAAKPTITDNGDGTRDVVDFVVDGGLGMGGMPRVN